MYLIMKTIKDKVMSELIIKNSRFICLIYHVDSIEVISYYLKEIQSLYPKASHYCYAYLLNDLKKTSDDGEPSKTAGMPILNVLEKEGLTNVLCIVVRYFGGIKLGAGGLVRAYSKSTSECLKKAQIINLVPGYILRVVCSYEQIRELEYLLIGKRIIDKQYLEKAEYQIQATENFLSILKEKGYSYQILQVCYIEDIDKI